MYFIWIKKILFSAYGGWPDAYDVLQLEGDVTHATAAEGWWWNAFDSLHWVGDVTHAKDN